jgi:hypothetical protein
MGDIHIHFRMNFLWLEILPGYHNYPWSPKLDGNWLMSENKKNLRMEYEFHIKFDDLKAVTIKKASSGIKRFEVLWVLQPPVELFCNAT